jgi:uncharacterized protein YjbJ (UPF0337 family)
MACRGTRKPLIHWQFERGTAVAIPRHLRAVAACSWTRSGKMNWDRIEGNWKQLKGKVKEQWGKLTDDHIDQIAGNKDQLVGKIQEQYGISKDEAERQVGAFETRYRQHQSDDISVR